MSTRNTTTQKSARVTEQELGKLTAIVPVKSCQLDYTNKLKQVLDQCIPAVMYITNLFLETSEFCAKWNEALVKLVKNLHESQNRNWES